MSIPDHAIGCLCSQWSPTHLQLHFIKSDHLLEVDAPPIPETRANADPANGILHANHTRELIKLVQDIVETVIHTIDFMSINSAILAPQTHGGFALIPKASQVEFYTIRCRPWAPLIDIREVKTTRWCAEPVIEARQGLWRGREIEIFVACDSASRVAIQRYTDLLHALHAGGLDLCSPVVGHLVKDGSVIGVATEIHTGLATYEDRALLYDAFQQLERENIFCRTELCAGSIYISDGKVRFGYMCAPRIRPYSGPKGSAFLEAARKEHWSCLDDFLSSKLQDVFFSTYTPTRWDEQFRILAYIPTPERPILFEITLDARMRSKWVKHRRLQSGQSRKPLLTSVTNETSDVLPFYSSYHDIVASSTARIGMYEIEEDTPLPRELGTRPGRHRHVFDPYRRVSTHIRFRSGWDGDSDVTSEATPSIVELSPSD